MRYRNESNLTQCISLNKKGFRPVGLRFRPVDLCFRPQGLRSSFLRLFLQNAKKVSERESGGGGYSLEFLVGMYRPHLQIQTQFQIKKCHFPYPFSDLASKMHTRFQT